jgi:hypothetical protein
MLQQKKKIPGVDRFIRKRQIKMFLNYPASLMRGRRSALTSAIPFRLIPFHGHWGSGLGLRRPHRVTIWSIYHAESSWPCRAHLFPFPTGTPGIGAKQPRVVVACCWVHVDVCRPFEHTDLTVSWVLLLRARPIFMLSLGLRPMCACVFFSRGG